MSVWRDNLRGRAATRQARDLAEAKATLLRRITDVCADIDVWRDDYPATALAEARQRLGDDPTLAMLQREHARLLREASLRGRVLEEVTV